MSLRLTEKDRRVLEAFTAKNGVSNIPMAGIWLEENRKFSISRRSVYSIVSKLVKMQYLRKLPGDVSPATYEPGAMCYKEKRGGCAKNSAKSSVVATGDSPIYPAPFPLDGVVVAKECPDGYGALHLNGSMSLTVSKEGSFDDVRIGNLNVGRWKPEHRTPGAVNRSGEIDIDGQRITFNFRRGINTGNLSFSLRPARIFIDPAKFQTREQLVDVFRRRAMKVSSILARYGWMLTDPEFDSNSKIELAFPDSPLVTILPNGHSDTGFYADGSKGHPEAELVINDDRDLVRADIVNESIRLYFMQIYSRYSERADANDYVLRMMEEVGQ
ncbi:MAG: hypothetical protein AB7E75_01935 [Candidatus Methanomethylophilaceae archaeon]